MSAAINELIRSAERCIKASGSCLCSAGSLNLEAIAHLLHAQIKLGLEERAERARGCAAEVAKRLAFELPILDAPGDAKVIPTVDGAGFVISGWPDGLGGNGHAVMRVWRATKVYRAAGWRITFEFDCVLGCSRHVWTMDGGEDSPFCVYCGHVPESAR
jgi:hypothetical protein